MPNISRKPFSRRNLGKIVRYHLPVSGVLLIIISIIAIDYPPFELLRNEETFALMLVVGIPLGIFLILVQLGIWVHIISKRTSVLKSSYYKKAFLILATVILFFLALRLLN